MGFLLLHPQTRTRECGVDVSGAAEGNSSARDPFASENHQDDGEQLVWLVLITL